MKKRIDILQTFDPDPKATEAVDKMYPGYKEWLAGDDSRAVLSKKKAKKVKAVVKGKRNIVFERDNNRCRFCGSEKDLTIDHIVPKSKGGKNHLDNYQTLCFPCNTRKSSYISSVPFIPAMLEESEEKEPAIEVRSHPDCACSCHQRWSELNAYCYGCNDNHGALAGR